MVKKIALIVFILFPLLGCVPFDLVGANSSANGGGSSANPNMEPTIASLLTSEPELHPTATLFQPQSNYNSPARPTNTPTQGSQAPNPTGTSQPNPPSSTSSSITLTSIENGGSYGDAYVFWDASGTFPAGFKVLWSATNSNPVYPADSNLLISDSGARSAIIHAQAGKSYYFRVCRYTGEGCDSYSNVYGFKLVSQAVPTATTGSSIEIQTVEAISSSEARVTWSATGSFSQGFKVVWSDSTATPTYPGNSAVFAGSDARSAIINGNPGTKYYIRVCKYNGSGCDFYSSKYTFTFATAPAPTSSEPVSLTITGMSDKVSGAAYINWSATGSFPLGFKIAWSATNSNPAYPPDAGGLASYISDGSARSAVVNGTPGTTYYFRVCQYLGGACGAYSSSYTFTFVAAPEPTSSEPVSLTITGMSDKVSGAAYINWSATGSFPLGFKIAWSATNSNPAYPPDAGGLASYISDGSARSAVVNGTPGTTYYFRVCQYLGGACGAYSNSYTFTFAAAPAPTPEPTVDTSTITLNNVGASPNPAILTLSWTPSGSFPNGFKIIWSATNPTPTYPDGMDGYNHISDPAATSGDTLTLESGKTYYLRVCKYNTITAFLNRLSFLLFSARNVVLTSNCSAYSNVLTYTVIVP